MGEGRGVTGSGKPDPQPLPKPVRYTLLILLGAVVGTGLVLLLYSRGILPFVGPFVAMFLGPLFVWLGLLWRRHRITRLSRAVAEELERIAGKITDELRRPPSARSIKVPDRELDQVAGTVRRSASRLAYGQEIEAVADLESLSGRTAGWPGDAALTVELRRVIEKARPLAKQVRRAERITGG